VTAKKDAKVPPSLELRQTKTTEKEGDIGNGKKDVGGGGIPGDLRGNTMKYSSSKNMLCEVYRDVKKKGRKIKRKKAKNERTWEGCALTAGDRRRGSQVDGEELRKNVKWGKKDYPLDGDRRTEKEGVGKAKKGLAMKKGEEESGGTGKTKHQKLRYEVRKKKMNEKA